MTPLSLKSGQTINPLQILIPCVSPPLSCTQYNTQPSVGLCKKLTPIQQTVTNRLACSLKDDIVLRLLYLHVDEATSNSLAMT
jgi:hypothetical protein